jgi:hypothetical protein
MLGGALNFFLKLGGTIKIFFYPRLSFTKIFIIPGGTLIANKILLPICFRRNVIGIFSNGSFTMDVKHFKLVIKMLKQFIELF